MIEYVERSRARVRAREEGVPVASFLRGLDWVLLLAVAALVSYGLNAIAGITRHDVPGNPHYYLERQAIYAGLGLVGMILALLIDPDLYRRFRRGIYLGTTALMAFVFLAGPYTRGTKRWLDLGFFRFQPSEFGKLLFVLALAGFLADRAKRVGEARTSLGTVALAAGPIFLVFVQPDFGTTLVYGAALAAVLFVAGTRWTHLVLLGAAALLIALAVLWWLPASGVHVLKPYQQARLTGFTNPSQDPSGSTYNINQSITAIGSGGLRGRGVAGATQTSLDYLPEHRTDFVFASLAEQRGFLGAGFLLLLYLLVVWRGLRAVTVARDPLSATVAGAIVVAFIVQVFINAGMTMGIAPITGIPLPFLSIGGSSLVANLVAMGVLQSIHVRGTRRPAR